MPEGRGPRRAQEIFAATLELLTELGYDGLTVEGVAARSGVNKTTLYRWWPSKDALLGAALLDARVFELSIPDTGSLRGDLESLLRQVNRLLTGAKTGAIAAAALSAALHRPELADVLGAFFGDRLSQELPIFDRARERGELGEDTDPALLMDLLGGALWMRALIRQEAPRPGFVREIVDVVLRGASIA
ncbi:TetR/AcrR family transcriptional regulator [Amycolatopsis sp. YIM 10]|uniref:TetR/AcrR family transcriptional regulator n=1 Tax=Amycolatopsis sp. YIM 10 TaxID=2653857 RepID=UPI00129046AF|nr:TetR/AcrR family transcriptional regulator [Amycolatopsis sp. YIM 10]QFU87674.1 HTH-type transcriptional repressor KstR [Amycolatopsis sp. YIM 10]